MRIHVTLRGLTCDPRLHVLERRLPDWPADDLADLLAELDEAVTL